MGNTFISIFEFFKNRKVLLVGLIIAVFLLGGVRLNQIQYKEGLSKILPVDDEFQKLNDFIKNADVSDKLIFLIPTDSTINDSLLAKVDTFSAKLNKLEGIKKVQSEVDRSSFDLFNAFFTKHLACYLEESSYNTIDSLIENQSKMDNLFKNHYNSLISPAGAMMKNRILSDPLNLVFPQFKRLEAFQKLSSLEIIKGHFSTKNQAYLVVFAVPDKSFISEIGGGVLTADITELINSSQLGVRPYGALFVADGNATRIKEDIILTVSISVFLLVVIIIGFFKDFLIFFRLFLPVLIGATCGLIALTFYSQEISLIAISLGAVILGVSIDFSLHFTVHLTEVKSHKKVLKDISSSVILSALTTACAFFILIVLDSESLNELGVFAGFSVFFTAVFSLILLPHISSKKQDSSINFRKLLNRVSDGLMFLAGKRIVQFSLVILTVFLAYNSTKVEFQSDMTQFNYLSTELQETEDVLKKNNPETLSAVFCLTKGNKEIDVLKAIISLEDSLSKQKEQGEVEAFAKLSDLFLDKETQENRIDKWTSFWTKRKILNLKKSIDEAALKIGIKKNSFDSYINSIASQANQIDYQSEEVFKSTFLNELIYQSDTEWGLITLVKEVPFQLDEASLCTIPNVSVINRKSLVNKVVAHFKNHFSLVVNASMLVVFTLLLVFYGRIELAIISFAPIFLSWIWLLGIMSLLGISFNLINIIIATLIFGIGIDYSIFTLGGLLQAYKTGEKQGDSYSISILLSVLTTVSGTGVLVLAEHPAIKSVALVSVIGVFIVVFLTFTLERILFDLFIGTYQRKKLLPISFIELVTSCVVFSVFGMMSIVLTAFAIVLNVRPYKRQKKRKQLLHWIIQKLCLLIIKGPPYIKRRFDLGSLDFTKPSLIISNHQSMIEIPLLLMLNPKVLILTNNWVWNSPVFGRLIRSLDFFNNENYEEMIPHLKEKVKEGYTIVVFPEGTRSEKGAIKRFHKGAFYLAKELSLDIQPIMLFGLHEVLNKGVLILRKGIIGVKALPRISWQDTSYGTTYQDRTKAISKQYKSEYEKYYTEMATPSYFRKRLILNYIYKGPVLEWYTRIKTALENSYTYYHNQLPKEGVILDLGCGYGYLAHTLQWLAPNRRLIGIDYDREKIGVANNIVCDSGALFKSCDILEKTFDSVDAVVCNDVLHYMFPEKQKAVIRYIVTCLNPGGQFYIRDGNKELKEKHKRTVFSEFLSTNIGFNKTVSKLSFFGLSDLKEMVEGLPVELEVVDETKHTSNVIYILTKK